MQYIRILTKVFRNPYYSLLTLLITGLIFSGAVWLPNLQLIAVVAKNASLGELISLLLDLYGAIGSNFSFVSAVYTVVIALLFGINVSLLTYYIQRMKGGLSGIRSTGVSSVSGLISGIFGIGCAACGTFIFTSILTLFGIGGIIAYLPFGGEEFGFIGVGLLLYSNYILINKINDPLICPTK